MSKKPETAQPTIDARTFIQNVNREQLQQQIADAQEAVTKAQGELRSLQSLLKMIDFRDGRRVWGAGKRGKKAAAPVEVRPDDEPLVHDIERFLAKSLDPKTTFDIAKELEKPVGVVKELLCRRRDKFQQVKPSVWALVE